MEFDPAIEELLKGVPDREKFIKEAIAQKAVFSNNLSWEKIENKKDCFSVFQSTSVQSPAATAHPYEVFAYWYLATKGDDDKKHPYARCITGFVPGDRVINFGDREAEASQPLTPTQAYDLSREWLLALANALIDVANACPDPRMFKEQP